MTEIRQNVVRTAKGEIVGIAGNDYEAEANRRFVENLGGMVHELARPTRARERRIAMYEHAIAGESALPRIRTKKPVQP